MNVTASELNLVYSALGNCISRSRDYMTVEYNYYVDDILKSSLPYQSEKEAHFGIKFEARTTPNHNTKTSDFDFVPSDIRSINFFDNLLPPLSNPNSSNHSQMVLTPLIFDSTEFLNLTPGIAPKNMPKPSF